MQFNEINFIRMKCDLTDNRYIQQLLVFIFKKEGTNDQSHCLSFKTINILL